MASPKATRPAPDLQAAVPSVRGLPVAGNLLQLSRDPLAFFTRLQRECGDVAVLYRGPRPIYLFFHPDDVGYILQNTGRTLYKGYQSFADRHVLGQGLVSSEGDFWKRQRRLTAPAFHYQRIVGYSAAMTEITERQIAGWRDGETRDIRHEMTALTQAIVARTLFDADNPADTEAIGRVMHAMTAQYSRELIGYARLIPQTIVTPGRHKLRQSAAYLNRVLGRMIAERRAENRDRGDLLSMLLAARDDDGAGMSDAQLLDELRTLFLAGHETTANALCWIWHLLGDSPEATRTLQVEADALPADRPLNAEDLEKLPYAGATVKEAMRLYPPVWGLYRLLAEPLTLGGYALPAHAPVIASQWVTHRDARWFPDPLTFRPERWLSGETENLPRYAYFPFGGGPRLCIGQSFALMEATLLLATIARRFSVAPLPRQRVMPEPSITLRLRNPLRVRLSRRL